MEDPRFMALILVDILSTASATAALLVEKGVVSDEEFMRTVKVHRAKVLQVIKSQAEKN